MTDFDLSTPRAVAHAVNELAGIPGAGAHEEALTRLITTGARSGWNSLTQADFDQAQNAFDDAMGLPRRKRQNPILWKITFWWHWHVTSPIVYPAIGVLAWAWFYTIRQWLPGAIRVAGTENHRCGAIEDLSRFAAIRRTRWARRHGVPVRRGHTSLILRDPILILDLRADGHADAYRAAFPASARAQYWAAAEDHWTNTRIERLWADPDPGARAGTLADWAQREMLLHRLHDAAFGPESWPDDPAGDAATSIAYGAMLLDLMATAEQAFADGTGPRRQAPHAWVDEDLAFVSHALHGATAHLLDRLTVEPDPTERAVLYTRLWIAAYPVIGGQAAEHAAALRNATSTLAATRRPAINTT